MGRFMGGAIWGAIVGVLGLGVVSQLAPVPGKTVADAPTVAAPAPASDAEPAVVPETAVMPEPETEAAPEPVAEPAPVVVAPPAPTKAADAATDTPTEDAALPVNTPAAPVVSTAAPEQAAPPEPTVGTPAVVVEDAAVPAPANAPLAQPTSDMAPVIAQAPVEPPVTPPTDAPAAQVVPDVAAAPAAPVADAPAEVAVEIVTPANPTADTAPAVAELPPPPPLTPEEQDLLDAAVAGAEPLAPVETPIAPQPDTMTQATPEIAPALTPDPAPPTEPATETATLVPETGFEPAGIIADAAPSTLAPTPPLGTQGAVTDRSQPQADDVTEVTEPLPDLTDDSAGPLTRFAAPFDNPDAKPLFSLVLIDDGAVDLDRAALAALPFAVSFVVDPLSPGAAEAAATYRAGGKEVLMLATGIPEGATPADLEQTFQAHAAALPEAVAVIDLADAGFQNDRALATQLVPILAAQGRGLLTWDRGLNAADQVARREALPTAMVFRALDAEGEDAPVIRRYLDRAAFKAAQEGAVTVVGQTRPETVAALLEWAVEGRASTVALAPVSAVLAGQ